MKNQEKKKRNVKTSQKILVAFLLNFGFSVFELIGGILTNSVAISSDAIHDFGDAIGIGLAFFLEKKSQRKPDEKFTYGYLRYSVIGSLITTMILIAGSILVVASAVPRFFVPADVDYRGMILLAVIGVVVNFAAAWFTRDGDSLNQKSVNLHMFEDVLGWAVVLIGAILMNVTNIAIIDALLSIGVAIFIFVNAFGNLLAAINLFLEKSPKNLSPTKIKNQLSQIANVAEIHHIHLWSLDGNAHYATLHVVTKKPSRELKMEIRAKLLENGISHVTMEFETPDEACENEKCDLKMPESNRAHQY